MKTLSPSALATALDSAAPPAVLDVRLADDFAACHIPQAIHNAVFEVAFHDRLPQQLPDQTYAIVIYGARSDSAEAMVAVEKLNRAGYLDVALLTGGIAAWQKQGHPTTCGAPLPAAPVCPDGKVAIDLTKSMVEWLGRNLLNKHHGCVALKSGQLEFAHGELTGGEFAIDLTKLSCGDLAGNELHDVLIAHLQSDDFFDTARYPEARFVITSIEHHAHTAGSPNLRIHGELTIKDRTHAIAFDAATGLTDDGKAAAQATFAIDRTLWNVIYGSGKFFHRLAGHLVNDLIEFQIKIVSQ